jgi:hypothetical protein
MLRREAIGMKRALLPPCRFPAPQCTLWLFILTVPFALLAAVRAAAFRTAPTAAVGLTYTTTWLGNTFGGGPKWVQNFVEGMYVSPDGTVYAASGWDEAGREFGLYRDGDAVGMAGHTHGWGYNGGVAVTANTKYVFLAQTVDSENGGLRNPTTWPVKGKKWFGVSRRMRSDVGRGAPFAGGKGGGEAEGRGAGSASATLPSSFLVVNEADEKTPGTSPVRGLAADDRHLYVAIGDAIRVFDAETMQPLQRSWPVRGARQLALDASGGLWVLHDADPPQRNRENIKGPASGISRFTTDGKPGGSQILLAPPVQPTGFCLDRRTGRLLVTDNGPAQQVLIFGNLDRRPRLVGTLGEKNGVYGGNTPGAVGPLRLPGPMGVGLDARGNIYVGCNQPAGGAVLRSFSPDGKRLRWELLGLEFVDTADAANADATDVYTTENRYTLDWRKAAPGGQATWRAQTLDPFRFPNDPRLTEGHHMMCAPLIRTIGGKRFLVVRGMFQHSLVFYRFDERKWGEIAVPAAMISKGPYMAGEWKAPQPDKGRWLWRDTNGDGDFQKDEFTDADGVRDDESWAWWVDENGGVWQGQQTGPDPIRYTLCEGLDKHGNPIYRRAATKTFALPAPMNHLLRIEYLPKSDVMYLTGHTTDRPKTGGEWGQVGSEVLRIDNWSRGSRTPRYRVALPYQPETAARFPGASVTNTTIKSFCTAGDRLFAVESRTAKVHVYDADTGAKLGELTPGPEVAKESGWVDFPDAIRATRRPNGEYIVFVEEDAKAKVIIYRLKG